MAHADWRGRERCGVDAKGGRAPGRRGNGHLETGGIKQQARRLKPGPLVAQSGRTQARQGRSSKARGWKAKRTDQVCGGDDWMARVSTVGFRVGGVAGGTAEQQKKDKTGTEGWGEH